MVYKWEWEWKSGREREREWVSLRLYRSQVLCASSSLRLPLSAPSPSTPSYTNTPRNVHNDAIDARYTAAVPIAYAAYAARASRAFRADPPTGVKL